MCLASLSLAQHERFVIVLATNRDELFARAAAPLGWWRPEGASEPILAGRDLSAGGTWLGLGAGGRLALVTNVREPGRHAPGSASRGHLVPQWLTGDGLPPCEELPRNGFNLLTVNLAGNVDGAAELPHAEWFSNRPSPQRRVLGPGLHGLSNAALNTPWPKVRRLGQALEATLAGAESTERVLEQGFAALADATPAPDDALPSTGVPLERERQLSPAFIRIEGPDGSVYGTRCSTLVVVERLNQARKVTVVERSFDAAGRVSGERREALRL